MAPLYRWDTLQLHHGSPEDSFELLCALLAERDERFAKDPRNRFIRNGRPDGGLECYWVLADGTIHGYQAKYHRRALGASQWAQLKSSIDTALKTHPQLTGVTVCLPQDLPDSPQSQSSRGKLRHTSRALWEQNRATWQATASRSHPGFTLDLWGDTAIANRLQDPPNVGLLKFFFDPDVLTPESVKQHVATQTARVGPRYQPVLHVTHPFEDLFDWLTMTSDFRARLVSSLHSVRSLLHRDELAVLAPTGKSLVEHVSPVVVAIDALIVALSTTPTRAVDRFARALSETLHDAVFGRLYEHRPGYRSSHESLTDTERYAIELRWRRLKALADALSKHLKPLGGKAGSWQFHPACDGRFAALSGSGGCGKTHLLCELAQRIASREQPVALLLGQSLDASRFGTDRLLNARLEPIRKPV